MSTLSESPADGDANAETADQQQTAAAAKMRIFVICFNSKSLSYLANLTNYCHKVSFYEKNR